MGLRSSREALKENSFSCLFQLLKAIGFLVSGPLPPSSKPVTLYLSDPASILADTAGKASQFLRTPAIRLAPPE